MKNSYHSLLFTNAVSSGGASSFFERVALVVGVLLSSKSLVCLLGCLLAFLRRVALHAVSSSKDYFVCGVAWLVGLLGLWRCLACGEVIFCLLLFSFYK